MWKAGGHYEARGDFREISGGELPVILHHVNRHDRKAGDKVELVETGILSLAEMNEIEESVFDSPASDNRILRIDLAADIKTAPVQWFRDNTYVRMKQTNREWATAPFEMIGSRQAQTLTQGVKPNQFRIYDKTGHRKALLASELRKMTRDQREVALTFEQRWGYPETVQVTRIERQLGAKHPEKFGIGRVGNLVNLDSIDPFTPIIFPEEVRVPKYGKFFTENAAHILAVESLRERCMRDGLKNTQDYLDARCKNRNQYRRLWKQYAPFVMSIEADEVTRKDLLESFRTSIHRQFNRAA